MADTQSRRWDSECVQGTLLIAIVAVALGTLIYHFARNPAVWNDEVSIVLNLLTKSYQELCGRLDYEQAAPPVFMLTEKWLLETIGNTPFAFRLLPFLASCAAVLLFALAIRQALGTATAIFGVLLLAFSDRFLFHAVEAKPYALDILIATLALAWCATGRQRSLHQSLRQLLVASPIVLWFSYTACFVIGGVFASLLPEFRKSTSRRTWILFGSAVAVTTVSFLTLYLGPVRSQRSAALEECWMTDFADWSYPWLVPAWVAGATARVFEYAMRPIGMVFIVPAVFGTWVLWRGGHRRLAICIASTWGLACFAGMIHAYPFGGSRLQAYLIPSIALAVGAGTAHLLTHLHTAPIWFRLLPQALVSAPLLLATYGVLKPWPRFDIPSASALIARQALPGEYIVCHAHEALYYFHGKSAFAPDVGHLPLSHQSAWLIATGKREFERRRIVESAQEQGWSFEATGTFERTVVGRLRRNEQVTVQPMDTSVR